MSRIKIRGKVSGRQIAKKADYVVRMGRTWKRLSRLYRSLIFKQGTAISNLKHAVKGVHDGMRCCGNCAGYYKDKNQRLRCGDENSECHGTLSLPWSSCKTWKLSQLMVQEKKEVQQ